MMIKVYDRFNNFTQQIDKYKNLRIEKEINKRDMLFFDIPKSFGDTFEEEGYIEVKNNGRFVIKEKNLNSNGYTIVGEYDLEDLNDFIEAKAYVTETPKEMLNDLLEGTGWEVVSNITTKRTVTAKEMDVTSIIKKIVDTFNAEIMFDNVNKIIYIEEKLGTDKGVYFHDELNLRQISISSDTHDFATRLIPRGLNGEGIEQINNGVSYVENHSYSDKIITQVWQDERYTNMNQLKTDAEKKLEVLSKPRRSYSADVVNLAKASRGQYDILDYSLGDTITIVNKDTKTREKQRIMKMVHYPNNSLLDKVEIENRPRSFGDKQEEQIESLEVRNGVIKASLELLEDSVVSTVEKIENLRIEAENRLYQSQTQIPFDFNEGKGTIQLFREAYHPYYKVTSDTDIDLSASFPQSQYAEDLEGEEVTISLDVLVDVDRIVTIDGKEFDVKGNRWTRIHVTKEFPVNTTVNKRVRVPYSRKNTRDKVIGSKLINNLTVDINTIYYRNLQIQKGSVPSNWTLTPEELEENVNRYSTQIKQLVDSIAFMVRKDELSTEIIQNAESVVAAINTTDGVGKVKTVKVTVDELGLTVDDGAIIIRDSQNTAIITSDGLKFMSVYTSSGELNGFQKIGIWDEHGDIVNREAMINITIPEKLRITKAELITLSMAKYLTGWSGIPNGYYHARNLSIFKDGVMQGFIDYPADSGWNVEHQGLGTDITNVVWGGKWNPTGQNINEKVADVTNHITNGKNTFLVNTSDAVAGANTRYSGGMQFVLVVEGYLRG